MARVGEKYRLKAIKDQWYTVERVSSNSVVLKGPDGHQDETLVSLQSLKSKYTQEK